MDISSTNTHDISTISKLNTTNISNTSNGVNIKTLNVNKEYSECESALEFFIISLCKNLNINSRQSIALLSNNRKYLTIMCFKGIKQDFNQVLSWFDDINNNLNILINILKNLNDEKSISMSFATLGVGIYSKCLEISNISNLIIYNLSKEFEMDWDWFKNEGLALFMFAIDKHPQIKNKLLETIISLTKGKYNTFMNILLLGMKSNQ
jgi:hypothetical protein